MNCCGAALQKQDIMKNITLLPDTAVKRPRLHEQVGLEIEKMIRVEGYQPGDFLPSERQFMERFQVGRSSVREALTMLGRRGVVTVRNGERARVSQPTPTAVIEELSGHVRQLLTDDSGIRHFQEARALLEIGLARTAAQMATEQDLAALRVLLERNRIALEKDSQFFLQTDADFHFAIAAITGNPIFTAVYQGIVEWLDDQRQTSAKSADGNRMAYAAHERIFQAIESRDPVAAEAAMQAHLDAVTERYWLIRQQLNE